MKKIRAMSEGDFLKLFFAFFTAAFLIAAIRYNSKKDQGRSNPLRFSYIFICGSIDHPNRRTGY